LTHLEKKGKAKMKNEKQTRQWYGSEITNCQLCRKAIQNCFVDGKTKGGSWAIMCPECHAANGGLLGIGLGQEYRKVWEKT